MFCSKCGNMLSEGAIFCSKCGERVCSVESTPSESPNSEETTEDSGNNRRSYGDNSGVSSPDKKNSTQENHINYGDDISGEEVFKKIKSLLKEVTDWFKALTTGKQTAIVIAILVVLVIAVELFITLFRWTFSSPFAMIAVVAGGYFIYYKWIAKLTVEFIYSMKSQKLQLPEGMSAKTLLESLGGKLNYPYFKGVRYGEKGECIIDGKYSAYPVVFNEENMAGLTYDDAGKRELRLIMLEAMALRNYINKFFNPTLPIDVLKAFNKLKAAESQRRVAKASSIAASVSIIIAIIVSTLGQSSSSDRLQGGYSSVATSTANLDKSLYGRWRASDGTIIELSNEGIAQTSLSLRPWWAIGESSVLTWEATNGQLSLISSYVAEYKYTYYPKDYKVEYLADHLKVGSLTCHRVNGNTGDSMIGVWDDNDMGGPFFTFNADGTGAFANDKYTIWEADDENVYIYYDLITTFDYYVQGNSLQLFYSDGSAYFTKVSN